MWFLEHKQDWERLLWKRENENKPSSTTETNILLIVVINRKSKFTSTHKKKNYAHDMVKRKFDYCCVLPRIMLRKICSLFFFPVIHTNIQLYLLQSCMALCFFFFFYLCFHLLVVHKTLSKAKVSANWKNDLVEAHLGTQASISRSNAQMNKYFVFFFSFRKRFSSCYNTSTANL